MNRHRAFTLIETLVVLAIIGLLTGLLLAGVQRVRAASARTDCSNRLRQLGLANQQFLNAKGNFPCGMSWENGKSKTLYASWQISLLPYLERDALYRQALADFARSPSPAGPPQHEDLGTVLDVSICPADPRLRKAIYIPDQKATVAFTSYQGVCGANCFEPNGILFRDSAVRLAEVTDGASQTLLIGERPPSADFEYGWWYAGRGQKDTGSADLVLGVLEESHGYTCPRGPYVFQTCSLENECDSYHFWSLHPNGCYFVFADGSVHFLTYSVAPLLPALASRAGGETIPSFD